MVPIHAAMKADATLEAGDLDGYAVLKRIPRTIEEIQGTEPNTNLRGLRLTGGFPKGRNSESMRRTTEDVRHGLSDWIAG